MASRVAPLPEASRPFDDGTPRGMLHRGKSPAITEFRIGFDTRAVDIVRYLPADPSLGIDSTVLWQAHYDELSDYLADLAMSGQEVGWLRELDSMRSFRDSAGETGNRFELPVRIPEWAKKLGVAKPALTLTGSYVLSLKAQSQWDNIQEKAGTANRVPDIIPEQIPNIFLTGSIGRLITVTLNWTEDGFGANQSQMLQIRYAGEKPEDTEDDILQEAAFGQIALNLPGSTLTGYNYAATGLIGLLARMRFGDLDLTVVGGAEKGERQRQKLPRGATETRTVFLDNALTNPPRDLFLNYAYKKRWLAAALETNGVPIPLNGLQLFQRVRGDQISQRPEWKPFFKGSAQVYDSIGKTGIRTSDNETWRRLTENTDWWWDKGLIRINPRGTATDEAIGAFWDDGASFGKVSATTVDLVLLRDNTVDHAPLRLTQLRNRYYKLPSVADGDLDQVQVTIRQRSGGSTDPSKDSTGNSWTKVFGLEDSVGKLRVRDNKVFDWAHGALIFPAQEPFRRYGRGALYDSSLTTVLGTSYPPAFEIEVVARGKSDKIEVRGGGVSNVSGSNCMDIREGSEILTLNGSTPLERGTDYDVTYSTGSIYLLSPRAKDPSADIQVDYECTPFFSLETRTVAGARLDWQIPGIGTDSRLGATLLYRSETVTDPRPQIDREPNRAWLWGANMSLAGDADWLTTLADRVPLVKPTGDSKWKFELEGAQSWNDPNTEGYALVDDFESARQEMSFPINRGSWYQGSPPLGRLLSTGLAFPVDSWKRKGDFVWSSNVSYALKNIYPNHSDGDNAAAQQNVLQLRLKPNDHGWGGTSWGSISRAFSSGTADNSQAKYLEVVAFGTGGVLLFDFGQVDEDLTIGGHEPNGRLDGEDVDASGAATGIARNDFGLDGAPDSLETGLDWSCFGAVCNSVVLEQSTGDPGHDLYEVEKESNDPSYKVNGTEGNNSQVDNGGGKYFDTEDLNRNGTLDRINNFSRFSIRLGGQGRTPYQRLANGWRLYRIPLNDTVFKSGTGADWSALGTTRITYTGLQAATGANTLEDRVQIARMALVGNQWRGGGHLSRNDSVEYLDSTITGDYTKRDSIIYPDSSRLNVTVVNNRDDANTYVSWDVPQSEDASSGAVLNEQSLRLEYSRLRSDFGLQGTTGIPDSGLAVRTFDSPRDFTLYRDLVLLVYHASPGPETTPVRFGVQYGSGDWQSPSAAYYEYSFSPVALACPLGATRCSDDDALRRSLMQNNWNQNKVQVALQEFAGLKSLRQQAKLKADTTFRKAVDVVPFGDLSTRQDSVLVKGNPSLSQVQWVRFWVRANPSASGAKSGEIWVNDLRVEHPDRSLGTALRMSAQTNMADLLDVSGSAEYREGDFVPMGEARPKLSQQASNVSLSSAARLNLAKFLPESWGAQTALNARISGGLVRPWAQPGSDVVLTKDGIGEMFDDLWEGDLRRDTSDLRVRNSKAYQTLDATRGLSTNWARQRDQGDGIGPFLTNTFFARPTVAWSWTETGRLAPDSRDTTDVQGLQVDYDFSPSKVPTLSPFRAWNAKPWMPGLLGGLGIQPWPSKITATLLDLDFTEHRRTSLDPDWDTVLISRIDTSYAIRGDTTSARTIDTVRAILFERSASVRHSLASDWQLLDFFKMSGNVGTDRSWTDFREANDFDPQHLWRATPRIFSLDTTLDPGQQAPQGLGVLRNENRRTLSWQMDFSPRILPFLTTGGSFRSTASASREANQLYVDLRKGPKDSIVRDTLTHQFWRLDQQDGFSANLGLSITDILRSLETVGPDSWSKGLGASRSTLDKWRFNSIGFTYGVDARAGGVRQTLGYLERDEGLDQAGWWRWQTGMGDERQWRSPLDLVTGSRSKRGLGQYEPWRLDDSTSYRHGFSIPSDSTDDGHHVDRAGQAATRSYQFGMNTSFTIPNIQLSVSPSWRWQQSWTEYWNNPTNVDTTTTYPSLTVNLQLANFADRFGFLKRYFASAVATHTTTWEQTSTVHPHLSTADEESRNLRFQPLLGLSFKTHGNWTFGNDVKYGVGWGYDYAKEPINPGTDREGICEDAGLPAYYRDPLVQTDRCFQITETTANRSFEMGDDATATYRLPTKRGIQILRWFLRLENDLVINFRTGWGYNRKSRHESDAQTGPIQDLMLEENTKVYARSDASYNFTPKLVAEFSSEYTRNERKVQANSDESKISHQILAQAQLRYNF